jgi:ribosome maturation factor RimP
MDIQGLTDKIKEIVEPVISSMGLCLEDIELVKMGKRLILRVFIDKEGGVTLGDCEEVSREIEAQLDVEDPIPCSYTLEVSSPGLDRPLKKPQDFKRFCGRKIRVVTVVPIERQTFFIGEIIEAGDNEMVLLLPKDRRVTLEYKNISRARLEVDV